MKLDDAPRCVPSTNLRTQTGVSVIPALEKLRMVGGRTETDAHWLGWTSRALPGVNEMSVLLFSGSLLCVW